MIRNHKSNVCQLLLGTLLFSTGCNLGPIEDLPSSNILDGDSDSASLGFAEKEPTELGLSGGDAASEATEADGAGGAGGAGGASGSSLTR